MVKKFCVFATIAASLTLIGCDAFGPVSQAQDFYLSIKSVKKLTLNVDFSDVKKLLLPSDAASLVAKHIMGVLGATNDLVKVDSVSQSNNNFAVNIAVKDQPSITFNCTVKIKKTEADVFCVQ